MPNMKSTPYYVQNYPKYVCTVNANALKPNYSAPVLPALAGYNPNARTDPLEAFIQGKLRILEAAIAQFLKEIEEREHLRDVTLDGIVKQM